MGLITETNQAYYEGSNIGGYQYVTLSSIVNNFILLFTGEGKDIPKANATEIMMHAKRAIQEFSYDVFKSYKAQEVEIPPSLTMMIPQDYVGWVKLSWIDNAGLEREILPLRITSNPRSILQDSNYDYLFDGQGALTYANESESWVRTKNESGNSLDNYTAGMNLDEFYVNDTRFGLDPEFANQNGGFYIDRLTGLIHFTSQIYGKIVHLHYISDGLAADEDTVVHKFAEDAIYKYIAYSIIAITKGSQEYLVRRYRKRYDAAKRVAKIRLSEFKMYALTQIMRGKSKTIK